MQRKHSQVRDTALPTVDGGALCNEHACTTRLDTYDYREPARIGKAIDTHGAKQTRVARHPEDAYSTDALHVWNRPPAAVDAHPLSPTTPFPARNTM